MPYNFVAEIFHTKKLCSTLSEVRFYTKNGHFTFLSPLPSKNLDRSFIYFAQSTRLTDRQTDERTDRQIEFSSLDRVCIPCSAVKIYWSDLRENSTRDDCIDLMLEVIGFRIPI